MTAIKQLSALPLMHALGWTLLHFCWQGAIVAILLACALCLLPLRASRLRYCVACAAMALMVVLPVVTFAILAGTQPSPQHFTVTVSPESFDHAVSNGSEKAAEPWTVQCKRVLNRSLPEVIGFWFAGVLVLLCRLNLGLLAARRLKSLAVEPSSAELQAILRALRIRLGVQRVVKLLDSARLEAPIVFGWLRPAVLLPVGCMTGLSTLQIEAILAHELAHIRRHDYLVNLFQSVMETMLFYHPAVWWLSNRIRREREHCCDDLAVTVCGDRLAYAKALSFLEERRSPLPAGAFGATGGVLKMRIARLLGLNESAVFPRAAAVSLMMLASTAAGLALWGTARAQSTAPQQPGAPQSSPVNPLRAGGTNDSFRQWLNQDVCWIIAPDERHAFLQLTDDQERIEFIRQFWERRNPNPGSSENKFKEEFYRRVAYANLHFAAKTEPGWETDRGHVYIVYGPPDSIDSYPRGGKGSARPRETWHYRSIQPDKLTVGNQNEVGSATQNMQMNDVDLLFVDNCDCGGYRLQSPIPTADTGQDRTSSSLSDMKSSRHAQPIRLAPVGQTSRAAAGASTPSVASPADMPVQVHSLKIDSNDLPESDQTEIIQDYQGGTYPLLELTERIRQALRDRGLAKASVEIVQPTATPQGPPPLSADVLARVSAGAKYTLGGFSIKGAQELSQDEIIQQFTVHPGDLFNATAIGEGLIRLKKLYEARGYVHFEVIPQLETDEVRHTITLILNIKEGRATTA